MKFLPQKTSRSKNNNADISDLSDELESIYSSSLTDVHASGKYIPWAVRRSYANNNSSSSGSVYRGRNSQLINNNSVHKAEVRSEPNVNNIETQSTGGSSVSSRIKQFESSKISKIMNKRGFSTKKGGGKSPSGKGVGNSSFNDDWRSDISSAKSNISSISVDDNGQQQQKKTKKKKRGFGNKLRSSLRSSPASKSISSANSRTSGQQGVVKGEGRMGAGIASSSIDEMEYSTLAKRGNSYVKGGGSSALANRRDSLNSSDHSITMISSQQYSQSAVGEYGVGTDYFIGEIDDQDEQLQGKDQTATRVIKKDRKDSIDNSSGSKQSNNPRPIMRQPIKSTTTTQQQRISSPKKETVDRRKLLARHRSKSLNDLSDLELLGETVQAVSVALLQQHNTSSSSSAALVRDTSSPSSAASSLAGEEQPYQIINVKFHRYGCVWDATVRVLRRVKGDNDNNEGFDFPIRVTCCADEQQQQNDSDDDVDVDDDVGRGSTATSQVYTIELSLKDKSMWDNGTYSSQDIASALDWVRRKVRRSLRRGLGRNVNPQLIPMVSIKMPPSQDSPMVNRQQGDTRKNPPTPSAVDIANTLFEDTIVQAVVSNDVVVVPPNEGEEELPTSIDVPKSMPSAPPKSGRTSQESSPVRSKGTASTMRDMTESEYSSSNEGIPIKSKVKKVNDNLTQDERRYASRGLMSQNTMRKLSHTDEEMDGDDDQDVSPQDRPHNTSPSEKRSPTKGLLKAASLSVIAIERMKKEQRPEGEIRMAKRGLLSQQSLRRLSDDALNALDNEEPSPLSDDDNDIPTNHVSNLSAENLDLHQFRLMGNQQRPIEDGSQVSMERSSLPSSENLRLFQKGLMSSRTMEKRLEDEVVAMVEQEQKVQSSLPKSEVRTARQGLISQRTRRRLSDQEEAGDDDSIELGDTSDSISLERQKHIEQAKLGLLSGKSMSALEIDQDDLHKAALSESQASSLHMTEGEIRLAKQGLYSRKSEVNFRRKGILRRSSSSVTFSDDVGVSHERRQSVENDISEDTEKIEAITKTKPKSKDTNEEEKDEESRDVLVFSDNDLTKKDSQDILTEGQYFLGISMLVYMYSHLRETCRMGHTRVEMEDIDVHSIQSQYRGGVCEKYLDSTKTAGSIIRVVIDELDSTDDQEEDNDIVGDENKEYEKSITAQFRTWIEDSRINQLDEETEKMIVEMKRKVARHRWKRAISAVRISYRISGGKPPKFENPVVAPGCENQNRFIDMNAMMSEAKRNQPKYFREGSVMHNLIESGIELVWFSDMSQNDVVYGICVQREEKKVTVVFRGTVNAHNWKMNLKFDTNEYRNPVKQNYPGRVDELSLHSGFALYLLRKRKDSGISKLQEIFDKIDDIGREMAPDGNYKLSITGHSLGGALATLCGFYVAARSRFAHLPTIYVWTFAAPRVGTQAFIHAWQHLERTGRIRHARFSSTQDLVPLVPFCNFEMDDLQFYKHVGIRVQLHGVGRVGKWRIKRNLDVTYPLRHDWSSEIRRCFMNNILANLTMKPSDLKNNHSLTQYQKRLHFTMTYKKALGSGVLYSDKRRNRIKTLDEYYHIRAKITNDSIAEEIIEQTKLSSSVKKESRVHVVILVMLLLLSWLALILSVSTDVFERHPLSFHTMLIPFSFVASGISHVIHLPVTIPRAIYHTASSQAGKALSLILPHHHDVKKTAFVGKHAHDPKLNSLINKLAAQRANALQHHLALARTQDTTSSSEDNTKLKIFDSTAKGLFHLASLVDDGSNPKLTIAAPQADDDMTETETNDQEEAEDNVDEGQQNKQLTADLLAAESRLKPLQEYATSITFDPKLDNLYLVGVGVRKKSIVKLYAVAMYSSATVLNSAASSSSLHTAARTFNPSTTPSTTFVLEMVYSVGAEKIAGAIGESVKPRYSGSPSDINALETLIVDGVNSVGGQASKGTIFRFDCSEEGVSVSVNGQVQGTASFDGLGSAFVDVFMDKDAVSPTLVDNCVETWSNKDAKDLLSSLVRLTTLLGGTDESAASDSEDREAVESSEDTADISKHHVAIQSQMKPLTDYATSVTFDPKLDDLYLIGVGVRKKSIISVYAVSMYSSAAVIETLSQFPRGKQQKKEALTSLHAAARTFDSSTPSTTFVLEMVYSVGAEKIAGAIGESVKPRYSGSPSDINALETLIVDGVNSVGGQASKGTIFRFDCSEDGVSVSVDGTIQGTAKFQGLGSAFVDVFMDKDAVSPTLVDSCLNTWTGVSLD